METLPVEALVLIREFSNDRVQPTPTAVIMRNFIDQNPDWWRCYREHGRPSTWTGIWYVCRSWRRRTRYFFSQI
jgi:hypothetical protein